VSVIAPPGIYAGISVFSGDGIDVNAGPSDIVILRGLTLNSEASDISGIVCGSAGTLHIESCAVNGFSSGLGVVFLAAARLEIKDSTVTGNGLGIDVHPATGSAFATIEGVRLEANFRGLQVEGSSMVTVRNCVASGNVTGILGFSNDSASPEINLDTCVASNNTSVGIEAEGLSSGVPKVRISNSTVTDNPIGLQNPGGVMLSRGNNTVEGNTTNIAGTVGTYSAK
jgi:hypothetical protein